MTHSDIHPGRHRQTHGHPAPAGPYGTWAQQPAPRHASPGPYLGAPAPGGPPPANRVPGGPVPPPAPEPSRRKKWPWAVGAIVGLVALGSMGQSDETPTAPTAPTAASAAAAPAPVGPAAAPAAESDDERYGATSATFGQQAQAGDVSVTAKKPRERSQEFIGTQYCSSVTLRNTGSSPETFSPFDWKFRTADGVEVNASIPFNADKTLTSGTLRPGGTVTGEVCADTETTDVTDVVYSPGFGILHEVTFSS